MINLSYEGMEKVGATIFDGVLCVDTMFVWSEKVCVMLLRRELCDSVHGEACVMMWRRDLYDRVHGEVYVKAKFV